jgi:hypothetical protein
VVKHHQEVPLRLLEPMPEHSCGSRRQWQPHRAGRQPARAQGPAARYAGQVRCIYIDLPYNTSEERGLERVEAEYPLGLADPTCPATFIITQAAEISRTTAITFFQTPAELGEHFQIPRLALRRRGSHQGELGPDRG